MAIQVMRRIYLLYTVIKTEAGRQKSVSGHAAASSMAFTNVNSLARELYIEAKEKLGSKIMHSKSTSHLAKMQSFLKGRPKFAQLMLQIQNLPKHLFLIVYHGDWYIKRLQSHIYCNLMVNESIIRNPSRNLFPESCMKIKKKSNFIMITV